jgi:hypothetical protein
MSETIVGFTSKTDEEGNIIAYPATFINKEKDILLRVFDEDEATDYTFENAISLGAIFVDVNEQEKDMFRKFFNIIS